MNDASSGTPSRKNQHGTESRDGPFLDNDPVDRPDNIFGGEVTLHSEPGHPSWLILPIVPPK